MSRLKLAFFTEAGSKRGMGHLIRSYTIYEEFKKNRDIDTRFFLDSDINFDYKFDDLNYFSWQEYGLEEDFDIILIDSYEASQDLYKQASLKAKVAVFIDDYGRLNYPKGIVINFLPETQKLLESQAFKVEHKYLLGLDYIPIREEFIKANKTKENQVFIMLGGSDTANLSYEILESIKQIDLKKVIVVNNEEIKEQLLSFENVDVLYKPSDKELVSHMAKSAFCLVTASMTLYELCYLQTPSLIIAVSQNQLIGAKQFIDNEIADDFVDIRNDNWKEELKVSISKLINQKRALKTQTVDGKGVQRITNEILELVK